MTSYNVRKIEKRDSTAIQDLLIRSWGSVQMVSRGRSVDMSTLPGFVAEDEGEIVGLLTFHAEGAEAEVVSLDAFPSRCRNR